MPRILISAGHTVMDPGAIFGDLREADLTRKIAPLVIQHLEAAAVTVQAVPLDLPLWQRLEWINNTGYSEEAGDILVEIHINDSDGTKRGIEAWYKGEGLNSSHKLAHTIAETMQKDGYKLQGVRSEYEHELGSLTFLNRANPAPVLLETLFIDNPDDVQQLKSPQALDKLARSVARGILRYLGKDSKGNALPKEQTPKFDKLKGYKRPAVASLPTGQSASDAFGLDDFPTPQPYKTGLNNPPATVPPTPPMPVMPVMMDREQRKKMIEDSYLKILGRSPSQSDLNYFLNMGISETELIKKMADSQDHADLVKAKKQLEEERKQKQETDMQLKKMHATVRDQKEMLDTLNALLAQKNKAIKQMEEEYRARTGIPLRIAQSEFQDNGKMGKDSTNPRYVHKHGWRDRLFRFLNQRVK